MLINPFSSQYEPKLDCDFFGNDSFIHPYRYQHFRRITAPYSHNGRELNLVWCIEGNGNTMFSIFEMGHD